MFIKLPKKLADEIKPLTIIISGGGTGGHVFPAIAIANELLQDYDIDKVIYIGCPDSLEEKIADENNITFLVVRIEGMPRKLSFKFIKWLYYLNRAIMDCISYLIHIKPDVVVGTGGYVSAPVLIAAWILDKPFVIHEADSHPGLVNSVIGQYANAVSLSFEKAAEKIKNKNINVLGNPLRPSIGEFSRNEAAIFLDLNPNMQTILILGGSQGAQKINNSMLEAIPKLLDDYDVQIIHQCGVKNLEEIQEKLPPELINNPKYLLKGFFPNMAVPLACSDIAISRAGSMTLSELAASNIPSVLVPYPYAAADHQMKNAKYMLEAGTSVILEDKNCTAENILIEISTLLSSPEKVLYMKAACSKIAKKNATRDIVSLIKMIGKPTTHSNHINKES